MMHYYIFLLLVIIYTSIVFSSPISPGHFNAHADDSGLSVGGSNFNAEAENNGQAVVTVGGTIHGFAVNRSGEEFNAISKNKGTSQVLIHGDFMVENPDQNAKKFDAVSESQGQSLVRVGNVVVMSGSRRREVKRQLENVIGAQSQKNAPWGAASVADHNTKPWENINHGDENNNSLPSSDEVAPLPSSTIATPITQPEVVEEAPTSVSPTIPLTSQPILVSPIPPPLTSSPPEIISSPTTTTTSEKPVEILRPPTNPSHDLDDDVTIIGSGGKYPMGSLNAKSKGQGSKSVIQVKGYVQY